MATLVGPLKRKSDSVAGSRRCREKNESLNGDDRTLPSDEQQRIIQFWNPQQQAVGSLFSVPLNITRSQLEELLRRVLQAASSDSEDSRVSLAESSFSLFIAEGSVEVTGTLGEAVAASAQKGAEETLKINFAPLAAFRVKPVTRCASTLQGHDEAILAASFSPDGKALATAGGDTTVRLWDLDSQTPLSTFRLHSNWVLCVAWAPHGQLLASAGMDGTVCLWDVEAKLPASRPLQGHLKPVTALAWQPLHFAKEAASEETTSEEAQGGLEAGEDEKQSPCAAKEENNPTPLQSPPSARSKTGKQQVKRRPEGDRGLKTSSLWRRRLGFALPDLLLASSSKVGRRRTTEGAASSERQTHSQGSRPARLCLRCVVNVLKDCTVRLWRAGCLQALRVLSSHSQPVMQLTWLGSSEGILVSAGRDTTVKVWNAESGALLRDLQGHAHWVNTLALNTDAVLRRGAFDPQGNLKAADTAQRPPLRGLRDDGAERLEFGVSSALKAEAQRQFDDFFSRVSGELLLSGSDDATLILRRHVGKGEFEDVGRMTGHLKLVNHVCFSPDGRYIASASFDKSIRLWNGATGQYVATLKGHVGPVYRLAWSADSRLLLSGSSDSTLKVWDVSLKKLKTDLPGHADEVYCVDWALRGTHAASGSKDRLLRIWTH